MADSPFITQDFDGGSDGNGLVTGNVVWWVPDRATGWLIGDASIDGVPRKKTSVSPQPDGIGYLATINYEGIVDGIDPPEDEPRQWNGRIIERQDPIETHPKFPDLLKTYKGTVKNGKVTWPETITSGSGSKIVTKANPMLNVTHYPVLLGEITYTRMVRDLPSSIFRVVGKVHNSLPTSSGLATPEGYVFVQALPQWQGYGNSFRLTDTYKLTQAEGWVNLIYKIIGR